MFTGLILCGLLSSLMDTRLEKPSAAREGQACPGRTAGFTILELVIAMSIMAVGILGIAKLFDTSFWAGGSAKTMNTASRQAQTTMERLTNLGYAKVLNDMGTTNYTSSGTVKTNWQQQTISGVAYTTTVRIDEDSVITGSVTADKALVTISWTERGAAKQVQYETYL